MLLEIRHSRYFNDALRNKERVVKGYYKADLERDLVVERSKNKMTIAASINAHTRQIFQTLSGSGATPVVLKYASAWVAGNPAIKSLLKEMMGELRASKLPLPWSNDLEVENVGVPRGEDGKIMLTKAQLPFVALAAVRYFTRDRNSRSVYNDIVLSSIVVRENGLQINDTLGGSLKYVTTWGFNPDQDFTEGLPGWDVAVGLGQRHGAIWENTQRSFPGIGSEYHNSIGRFALGRFPWWLQAASMQINLLNRIRSKGMDVSERRFLSILRESDLSDMHVIDGFYWMYLNGQPALLPKRASDYKAYFAPGDAILAIYKTLFPNLPDKFYKYAMLGPYDTNGSRIPLYRPLNDDLVNNPIENGTKFSLLDSWIGVPNLKGYDIRDTKVAEDIGIIQDDLGYNPVYLTKDGQKHAMWCEHADVTTFADSLLVITEMTYRRLFSHIAIPKGHKMHTSTAGNKQYGIKGKIKINL